MATGSGSLACVCLPPYTRISFRLLCIRRPEERGRRLNKFLLGAAALARTVPSELALTSYTRISLRLLRIRRSEESGRNLTGSN